MSFLNKIAYTGIVWLALALPSCGSHGIRVRMGSLPYFTTFRNISDLGKHNSTEKLGQIYTARAGAIDIDHLRKSADFTRYYSEMMFSDLMKGTEDFSIRMREPSQYFIKLNYPDYWNNISQSLREKVAKDVSISIGSHLTYTGATWHEILTWFGWKSTIIIPEFDSAFSCEDNFSNLLGVYLAEKVLREDKNNFSNLFRLSI